MGAPPRPRWAETALEVAAASSRPSPASESLFAAAVEEWADRQPYPRPGEPPWRLMNREQWATYDLWQELADDQDRKHAESARKYNAARARAGLPGLPVMNSAQERRMIW